MVRSSVDLPAPFAPMIAYTSPGEDPQRDRVQGAELTVMHDQVANLQQRRSAARPGSPPPTRSRLAPLASAGDAARSRRPGRR